MNGQNKGRNGGDRAASENSNLASQNDTRITLLKQIVEDVPGRSGQCQRRRMSLALQRLGSLTTFEAMRCLDIYDPRPRKYELVHLEGWEIDTIREKAVTESGEAHIVGRYVLKAMPGGKAA